MESTAAPSSELSGRKTPRPSQRQILWLDLQNRPRIYALVRSSSAAPSLTPPLSPTQTTEGAPCCTEDEGSVQSWSQTVSLLLEATPLPAQVPTEHKARSFKGPQGPA